MEKYISEEIDFSRWGKNLSIVPHSKTKIVGERRDRNNRAWLMFLTFSFLGFLPAKRTSIFLLLWWFLSLLVSVVDVFLSFLLRASSRSEAKLQTRVEVWLEQQKPRERKWDHSYLSTQSVYHRKEFRLGTRQITSTVFIATFNSKIQTRFLAGKFKHIWTWSKCCKMRLFE